MKTSRLIELLQSEMEQNGDLRVVLYDDGKYGDLEPTEVEFNDDEGEPVILIRVDPPKVTIATVTGAPPMAGDQATIPGTEAQVSGE